MIGRLIIKFNNKVYSVRVSSCVSETFFGDVDYNKVKLYFVDNNIIRKFYWDYMRPQFWTKKSLLVVDFLDKPHILSSIYMTEPLDTGDSDFLVILNPLIEVPKLPKAKMVKTEKIYSCAGFPLAIMKGR